MKRNLLWKIVLLVGFFHWITACAVAAEAARPSGAPRPERAVPARPVKAPTKATEQMIAPKERMIFKTTPTYLLTGHPDQCYVSSDLNEWSVKNYSEAIKPFTPKAIEAVNPLFFVMVGHHGKVVVSKDACLTLQLYSVGEDVLLFDVCYLPPSPVNSTPRLVAVASQDDSGMIYVSSDDGQSWEKVKTIAGNLKGVAGNHKGQAVAVGPGGFLYSHDGGQTWQDAQWAMAHIPLTDYLSPIYEVLWDPYDQPYGPNAQQPRFVFVMYGQRDNVMCFNFRYSSDGATWQTGSEDLSDLDSSRRAGVQSSTAIQSYRVFCNGLGRLITQPQMLPGTYYSEDGGKIWKLHYYNIPPEWDSLVDVTSDGQQFIGLVFEPAANGDRYLCTSPDGQTWAPITVPKEFSHLSKKIAVGVVRE